ncbi:MAG: undecaprenyl-diphosphate phosphatase [Phycisphaerales bacterium]
MTWWQAVILGIVEGLTEYLPVSSTGHLLIVQELMGIGTGSESAKEAADAYAICIQAGAILAVLGLYFGRVKQMATGVMGRDREGLQLLINMLAGFLPAAVIGLALNDLIKTHLFGPWPVVSAWVLGGVAILVVDRWRGKRADRPEREGLALTDLSLRLALVIGFAQCIAMWPGVSRSLVTIVAGVLVGLKLAAAVEFSFLLGVVTLGAATCYDGLKHGPAMLKHYGPEDMVLGFLFAFLSAVFAIKWMVNYLKSHGMAVFGYYRIGVGAVVAGLILLGWIEGGG